MIAVERMLTWSSVLLLIAAALSKVWAIAAALPVLNGVDPMFSVNNRYILIGVAIAELSCAAVVAFSAQAWLKALALAWIATNFILYRAALVLSGAGTPCPCLGGIGARVGLSSAATEFITKSTVVFFLGVAAFIIVRHRPRVKYPGTFAQNAVPTLDSQSAAPI